MSINGHEEFVKKMIAAQDIPEEMTKLMIERTGMYAEKLGKCIECTPSGDQAFILAALRATTESFDKICDPMARLMADMIHKNSEVTFSCETCTKEELEEIMK